MSCDKNDRNNFVFRLKKSETVEINSEDESEVEVMTDEIENSTVAETQNEGPIATASDSNHVNPINSEPTLIEIPIKRKRGRPRKTKRKI